MLDEGILSGTWLRTCTCRCALLKAMHKHADVLSRSCEDHSCANCTLSETDDTETAYMQHFDTSISNELPCCVSSHLDGADMYECTIKCRRSRCVAIN
jgi:hypothetical protein